MSSTFGSMRTPLMVLLALILALPLSAGPVPVAQAAVTFTVNSTIDEPDGNPGDGACASTPSGACTLRAAIMETNALAGADTVVLPAGTYTLTFCTVPVPTCNGDGSGRDDDLDIRESLTIAGAGSASTIVRSGGGVLVDRVFETNPDNISSPDFAVTMTGLTVSQGRQLPSEVHPGGGILNRVRLTLQDVVIAGNQGRGGLANYGAATLTDVVVRDNDGGGILNWGSLTATRLVVRGNRLDTAPPEGSAPTGSGIMTWGPMTLTNAVIEGNIGLLGGGILKNTNQSTSASLNQVLIANNEARASGPNLYGEGGGIHNAGPLDLTNVTLSGNRADRLGGGIYHFFRTATLTNVSLVGSSAGADGQSLLATSGNDIQLKNTLVSSNGGNCTGAIVSLGHNIETGSTCGLSATGDRPNTDPRVGPLANNGGFSQTHNLLPDSPAIDAANDVGCPSHDQRGVPRPRDGNGDGHSVCDIGAVEVPDRWAPLPAPICTARPTVGVGAVPTGDGRLRVTVTATSTNNALRTLRFGRTANALVELPGQAPRSGPFDVALPPGTTSTQFFVRRAPGAGGTTATVELAVVDGCGEWPTFVGGGPGAF